MSSRAKYTPAEDKAILDFAKAHGQSYPPTGNKLWQLAEAQLVTTHSWQSMKSRYLLLAPASKTKGKKRPSSGNSQQPTTQRKLAFPPQSSPAFPNFTLPPSFHLPFFNPTSTSTSTSTSTRPTLPRPYFTSSPRPCPTSTDASTQTDGTGMVDVGVGIHLFCPVAHYWTADVSTQTTRQPSHHRRSHSF